MTRKSGECLGVGLRFYFSAIGGQSIEKIEVFLLFNFLKLI